MTTQDQFECTTLPHVPCCCCGMLYRVSSLCLHVHVQEGGYRDNSPEPPYGAGAAYAAPQVSHVTASQVSTVVGGSGRGVQLWKGCRRFLAGCPLGFRWAVPWNFQWAVFGVLLGYPLGFWWAVPWGFEACAQQDSTVRGHEVPPMGVLSKLGLRMLSTGYTCELCTSSSSSSTVGCDWGCFPIMRMCQGVYRQPLLLLVLLCAGAWQ